MIDYINLPNYDLNDQELEEFLIFSICVANKPAKVIAPRVHDFCEPFRPNVLHNLKKVDMESIQKRLKDLGIGCHSNKAKCLKFLSDRGLDLRSCTTEDLEEAPGIGLKTSRFFLGHTRRGFESAILDTHILKFLKEMGNDVPSSTPSNIKKYRDIEKVFIYYAKNMGISSPELDIILWKHYAVERLKDNEWKKLKDHCMKGREF